MSTRRQGHPGSGEAYRFSGVLGERAEPGWEGAVEQTLFEGIRLITEAVFFHPATRTLILADLCFNVGDGATAGTRLLLRLFGMFGKLSVPRDMRLAVRDRDAARRSLQRILSWDFDRIIVGHGAIVETGGRAALQQAFEWLT